MNALFLHDVRSMTLVALLAAALGCGGSSKGAAKPDTRADDEGQSLRSSPLDDDDDDGDDDLAVEGLRGRMEVYDIQRGMEPHVQALSDCFTRKVGKQRYLGGEVEFKFVVHPDGAVKSVQLARSDLGAWPMEQCMLEINQAIQFPKPKGKGEADFTVPLSFDARQATFLWSDDRAQSEVDARVAELRACAEKTGTRDPRNIWITVYVGTRGKVLSAGFASPDAPLDAAWAACADSIILGWKLTDPRGQITKATFRYNAG
jgi:hypothetical protein